MAPEVHWIIFLKDTLAKSDMEVKTTTEWQKRDSNTWNACFRGIFCFLMKAADEVKFKISKC